MKSMTGRISVVAAALLALSVGLGLAISSLEPAHAATGDPRPLYGSETDDPSDLSDAAGESEDVTVVGAALGDWCLASHSSDVIDVVITCNVTAANTATVRYQNESGGSANIATGTLRVVVLRKPAGL